LSCPEYTRLRQHYESVLRHWGDVLLSQDYDLVRVSALKRSQLMQNALDQRDAARERVCVHKRTCPACGSFAVKSSSLVDNLLVRMALDDDLPACLRSVGELFAAWLLENPDDTTVKKLKKCLAEIDAWLKVLGRKEPDPVSNLARKIAGNLELPGNPMMLEFLTRAEALLIADSTAPEKIDNLLTRAGLEYALMVAKEGKKRHIQ
jgi:hypothetical protein